VSIAFSGPILCERQEIQAQRGFLNLDLYGFCMIFHIFETLLFGLFELCLVQMRFG